MVDGIAKIRFFFQGLVCFFKVFVFYDVVRTKTKTASPKVLFMEWFLKSLIVDGNLKLTALYLWSSEK